MIARSYILSNLKLLDNKYRKTTSPKELLFYSKLAILELCGWIEESMDDIVLRCAMRHLKIMSNKEFVRKQIVRKNYGFDYDDHFRRMLGQLIGIINVERLEKNVDQTKKVRLKAVLSMLKTARNAEAHTHIKGVTRHINAPSITLSQFPDVSDGLTEYDRVIRNTTL
jgi:hypothetical protein